MDRHLMEIGLKNNVGISSKNSWLKLAKFKKFGTESVYVRQV